MSDDGLGAAMMQAGERERVQKLEERVALLEERRARMLARLQQLPRDMPLTVYDLFLVILETR